MLVIVFGLLGSGKTYVSNLISKHFRFYFRDADEWLTPDMVECVLNGQLFTKRMMDQYLTIIINNISDIFKSGKDQIVISQALYREVDRQKIVEAYPYAIFIEVSADIDIIKKRVIHRKNWVGLEYEGLIRPYFEPMETSYILNNNAYGDSMLLDQLSKVLPK